MIEISLEILQWAGLLLLLYANGQQAKWIGILLSSRAPESEEPKDD